MWSTSLQRSALALGDRARPGPERTPDGRYIIVRGRLWRAANPGLSSKGKERLVSELMDARRDVGASKREANPALEKDARARVHRAKIALGERGPVWWDDGSPDENRKLVHKSSYADWWARCGVARQD